MYINPMGDNTNPESEKIRKKKVKKGDSKKTGKADDTSGFFDILMETEIEISEKELKKMVDEIFVQGNRFVRSPTMPNLNSYKESIKKYLKKVEKKMYRVKEEMNLENDSPRLHIIAEKVDEKIQQITESIMNKEKNTLFYAARVEEINGLLLDLYR